MDGVGGNADAGRDQHLLMAKFDRLCERVNDLSCYCFGITGMSWCGDEDAEFVATETGNCIFFAHTGAQALCRPAQHLVAGSMSELVIDRFEAIQIDEQDAKLFAVAKRFGELLLELPGEQATIGRPVRASCKAA